MANDLYKTPDRDDLKDLGTEPEGGPDDSDTQLAYAGPVISQLMVLHQKIEFLSHSLEQYQKEQRLPCNAVVDIIKAVKGE